MNRAILPMLLIVLCGMDCQGSAPLALPPSIPLDGTWRSRVVSDCPEYGYEILEISNGGTQITDTFYDDDGSVRVSRTFDSSNSAIIGDLLILRPFSSNDAVDGFTVEYELGADGVLREIGRDPVPGACLTTLAVLDRV